MCFWGKQIMYLRWGMKANDNMHSDKREHPLDVQSLVTKD
jgi:hypothetical protein